MKLKLLLLIAILCIVFGCTKKLPPNSQNAHTASKTIAIDIDIGEQQKLQDEVDKGHQPWRLDPVMVSESYCEGYKKDNSSFDCTMITLEEREATVICEGDKEKYIVHLKRLVKKDGIWTITSVDIIEKQT